MNIKGIPEGWKIKEIGTPKSGDYYLNVHGTAEALKSKNVQTKNWIILERDIKIIDMSKCKVDMEYRGENISTGEEVWDVCRHDNDCWIQTRVRENHYFGWQGGECPLPEGLKVSVVYRFGDVQVGSSSDQMLRNEFLAGENSPHDNDIIGFISHGPDDTHAYQHQIGES
tara:strand:+ start:1872 stop:2381 length:510 start_codon:yes stop_codon:yes gene_type:complete